MFYWVENWPGGKSSQQLGRTFKTAAEAFRDAKERIKIYYYNKKFISKAEKYIFCVIVKKDGCGDQLYYLYLNRFTVNRV